MLILLLAVMLFTQSPVQKSVNRNREANQSQQQKSDTSPSGTCINIGGNCSVNEPAPKTETDTKKDHQQNRPFWPISLYEWASIVGVGSAVYLLILVRRQTRANVDAARAADRSAKAAELTAERFSQIEGSQIIPALDWIFGQGTIEELRDDKTGALIATNFHLSVLCKNAGKAAGWVTEKRLAVGVFDHIPSEPDFDSSPPIECIFHGLEEVAPGNTFKTDYTYQLLPLKDTGHMQMTVIWGIIKYRDIFSDARESTFGYYVTVDRKLKRINYPIYNQQTYKRAE